MHDHSRCLHYSGEPQRRSTISVITTHWSAPSDYQFAAPVPREARRPAGAGAEQVRIDNQPQDCQGARSQHPAYGDRARRRGDRINFSQCGHDGLEMTLWVTFDRFGRSCLPSMSASVRKPPIGARTRTIRVRWWRPSSPARVRAPWRAPGVARGRKRPGSLFWLVARAPALQCRTGVDAHSSA